MAEAETTILQGIASDIARQYIGNFLSGVIGGGGSDVETLRTQIQKLVNAVAALQREIDEFIRYMSARENYDKYENNIFQYRNLIEADYDVLSNLQAGDQGPANLIKSNALQYYDAFKAIHDQMTAGDPVIGGNLVSAAAQLLTVNATPSGYDPTQSAPLATKFTQFVTYFRARVAVQIKAAVLIHNAYTAQGSEGLGKKLLADVNFPACLNDYAKSFLDGVERLVATYHHDSTLLDMLATTTDPLRSAQAFVQIYPAAAGARLWMWIGSGPLFKNAQNQPLPDTPTLNGVALQAETNASWGLGGDTWSVSRFPIPSSLTGACSLANANAVNASADTTNTPVLQAPPVFQVGADSYLVATAVTSAAFQSTYMLMDMSGIDISEAMPFTMECWALVQATGGLLFGSDPEDDQPHDWFWCVHVDDDASVKFGYIDQNQFIGVLSSPANLLGVWHHFAVTYDGNNTVGFFLDGVLMNAASNFRLTSRPCLGKLVSRVYPFNGYMNEFRLWHRGLVPEEIVGNMHQIISSGDGLIAAYGFDRGNVVDRSGQRPPLLILDQPLGMSVLQVPAGQNYWLQSQVPASSP